MIIYIEDILSILLGFFGALVTSLLLLSYKSNKHVNVYLIFILIFTTLKSFYIGLIPDHINALIYNKFNWLMPSLLLILPAFYLYFKSLIINEKKSFSNTIFHSLYPVFCSFVYLLQHVYILIPQEIWISIRKLNVVNYTFFYLGLTTLLLHNFYKNQKRDLKVEQHFNSVKTWILFLFITLILTSARALIEFYFDLEPSNGIFSVASSVLKTVFISFILLKVLTTPEILFGFPKLIERVSFHSSEAQIININIWNLEIPHVINVQDSKLTSVINRNLKTYVFDIEQYIQAQHAFRNSKYPLKNLAIDTNIPSSHLTYVIKYHCKLSFIEFKNHYRIIDSLHLIENDYLRSHTLDSLALKVGFVSYNSFYVSFKKQIGLSPKEYTDSKDNLIHSHPLFSS